MSVSGASFLKLVRLYSEESSIALKIKSMITHLLHAMIFNLSPFWCSWLVNNVHTGYGSLPVGNVKSRERFVEHDVTSTHRFTYSCNAEVESSAQQISDGSGRCL